MEFDIFCLQIITLTRRIAIKKRTSFFLRESILFKILLSVFRSNVFKDENDYLVFEDVLNIVEISKIVESDAPEKLSN